MRRRPAPSIPEEHISLGVRTSEAGSLLPLYRDVCPRPIAGAKLGPVSTAPLSRRSRPRPRRSSGRAEYVRELVASAGSGLAQRSRTRRTAVPAIATRPMRRLQFDRCCRCLVTDPSTNSPCSAQRTQHTTALTPYMDVPPRQAAPRGAPPAVADCTYHRRRTVHRGASVHGSCPAAQAPARVDPVHRRADRLVERRQVRDPAAPARGCRPRRTGRPARTRG